MLNSFVYVAAISNWDDSVRRFLLGYLSRLSSGCELYWNYLAAKSEIVCCWCLLVSSMEQLMSQYVDITNKLIKTLNNKISGTVNNGTSDGSSANLDVTLTDSLAGIYTLHTHPSTSVLNFGADCNNRTTTNALVGGAQQISPKDTHNQCKLCFSTLLDPPRIVTSEEVSARASAVGLGSLSEQLSQFDKVLRRFKSLQMDNVFLERSIELKQVPKGLRVFRLPMGFELETEIFDELLTLFDNTGIELMKLIIRNNNNKLIKCKDELALLNSNIRKDLMFEFNQQKYEHILSEAERFVNKGLDVKLIKLNRDKCDYAEEKVYAHFKSYKMLCGRSNVPTRYSVSHSLSTYDDTVDADLVLAEEHDVFLEPQPVRRSERIRERQFMNRGAHSSRGRATNMSNRQNRPNWMRQYN